MAILDFLVFFAYAGDGVQLLQSSFTDGVGITHAVSVSASSLFKAAALGVAEFKKCGFALAAVGRGTKLTIAVESPSTTHELTIGKLEARLSTNGRSPREQAMKVALRELLGCEWGLNPAGNVSPH